MSDASLIAAIETYAVLNAWDQHSSVVVALSGGKDSMLLFHIMNIISKKYKFNLSAVHIDHAQHEQSSQIASQVIAKVHAYGLECLSDRLHCPKQSSETVMRRERYQAFLKMVPKGSWLLMGHHGDDDIETWWLNVLRGCGLHNLHGMPMIREYGHFTIYRPMLMLTQAQVDCLHDHYGLAYWDDPSNRDVRIARNFLRGCVLPKLKEFFPNMPQQIERLREHLRSSDYWSAIAIASALDHCAKGAFISHVAMQAHPASAHGDLIIAWCRTLGVKHTLEFIELIAQHIKQTTGMDVYKDYTVFTAYGWSCIWKGKLDTFAYTHVMLQDESCQHVLGRFVAKKHCRLASAHHLGSTLIERGKHRVSLHKRSQSLKIPKWLRMTWPVIYDMQGNAIDWWTPEQQDWVALVEPSSLGSMMLQWFEIVKLSSKNNVCKS